MTTEKNFILGLLICIPIIMFFILSLPTPIAKKFCEYNNMEYENGFFINEECLGEPYKYVEGRETKYIFVGKKEVCFDDGLIGSPILYDCVNKEVLRGEEK